MRYCIMLGIKECRYYVKSPYQLTVKVQFRELKLKITCRCIRTPTNVLVNRFVIYTRFFIAQIHLIYRAFYKNFGLNS